MQKAEVPPYPVLCARLPHATGNGAREFACRDGVCRVARDRRTILVHEVPAQHERSVDPVLGLEVRSQQGGSKVLATDVDPTGDLRNVWTPMTIVPNVSKSNRIDKLVNIQIGGGHFT